MKFKLINHHPNFNFMKEVKKLKWQSDKNVESCQYAN